MMKIGIIGYGYVGKAVASAYDESQILISDPQYPSSTIDEIKEQCGAIFVCVPTPPDKEGDCDASILISALEKLRGYTGIVIAKSTATPSIYNDIETKFKDLKFAHVPEFLTAANAIMDYQCPAKIVIGCKPELRISVVDIILTEKIHFDLTTVTYCSVAEAAMFKYVANSFLAMKVIINNEFYDLCKSMNIDWNNVAKIAATDPRLGSTHWQVPGPDGSRGFGGGCFPKDTQALLNVAKFMCTDMSMLNTAIKKNGKLRS